MTKTTPEQRKQIAETIIMQMGGINRLSAMVRARDFVAIDAGLQFRFSGSRKANAITVKLTDDDLYDVTFYKVARGGRWSCQGESSGLYADGLVSAVERFTGLALSL